MNTLLDDHLTVEDLTTEPLPPFLRRALIGVALWSVCWYTPLGEVVPMEWMTYGLFALTMVLLPFLLFLIVRLPTCPNWVSRSSSMLFYASTIAFLLTEAPTSTWRYLRPEEHPTTFVFLCLMGILLGQLRERRPTQTVWLALSYVWLVRTLVVGLNLGEQWFASEDDYFLGPLVGHIGLYMAPFVFWYHHGNALWRGPILDVVWGVLLLVSIYLMAYSSDHYLSALPTRPDPSALSLINVAPPGSDVAYCVGWVLYTIALCWAAFRFYKQKRLRKTY